MLANSFRFTGFLVHLTGAALRVDVFDVGGHVGGHVGDELTGFLN